MNYRNLMTITAVVAIASGLFIASYVGTAFGLFLPDIQWPRPIVNDQEAMAFWSGVAFVRMFGVMLAGFGCLVLSLRRIRDAAAQQAIANMMILAGSICALMALVQWKAIWEPTSGLILAGGFFVMVIAFGWLRLGNLIVELSRTDQLQSEWENQISKAAAQQERNRLARDLHDSIKQQIFGINVSAATAQVRLDSDLTATRAALDEVRRGTREAMVEMETMLQHLRPAPLDSVGLVEALRQQCESLQYRTGAAVITQIGDLPESNCLPLGAQEAIFRIVQEALANIARHARAANVELRMYQQEDNEDGVLWLRIKDDGAGFNPACIVDGMGLTNIRTRASEIGGEAQIESRPNEGTSVIVKIPLVVPDSLEIKHQLRNVAIIATIGFFTSPFLSSYLGTAGLFNRLLGILLFGVAVMGYSRAHHALSRALDAKTISRKSFLRLKRYQHPTLALLYWVISWWLVELVVVYHLLGNVRELLYAPVLSFIFIGPLYQLYRLHQTLKEESKFSSPEAFYRSLNPMYLQSTVTFVTVLIFAGYYLHSIGPYYFLPTLFLLLTYSRCIAWWRWKASTRVPRGEDIYDQSSSRAG